MHPLDARSAQLKDCLLTAFYHDSGIIDSDGVQATFFDETNREDKLRLYALRNEELAPMIDSATAATANSSEINLVPSLFWYSLKATGAAGHNVVFCALMCLGDRIGTVAATTATPGIAFHRTTLQELSSMQKSEIC